MGVARGGLPLSTTWREAVVVGSGFGGSITACRLAQRWPGAVVVIERGRRYPMGSFPRTPGEMARNTWSVGAGEAGRVAPENRGLFEARRAGRMDVVLAAGVGGGSLVYSNVFLEPPPEIFDDARWPRSCTTASLAPYYAVAKEVLGARPVPRDDANRRIRRTEVFDRAAEHMGRPVVAAEVNVFFGDSAVPPGTEAVNAYGALQTACTYCAECNIGCNLHAKNTLDLNYLHRAEHAHGATILSDHLVEAIVPLDGNGHPSPGGDGTNGFLVTSRDLESGRVVELRSRRVVVAAGTLGTVELLLRCRDVHGGLARLPASLGEGFSGNGDFLMFVRGIPEPTDPCRGPVITRYIDHGLFDRPRTEGFVMQDSGYPALLAWFIEGAKPEVLKLRAITDAIQRCFARSVLGRTGGRVGSSAAALLRHGLTEGSAVLLCMGRDTATGTLALASDGRLTGSWPRRANRSLYRAVLAAGEAFKTATGAAAVFATPTWWLPFRRNVTVHALGGCRLAEDPTAGVVRADPTHFGEVFGYSNLYVADGSMVPTALGANPAATIAALAERVAEGITGRPPDAAL